MKSLISYIYIPRGYKYFKIFVLGEYKYFEIFVLGEYKYFKIFVLGSTKFRAVQISHDTGAKKNRPTIRCYTPIARYENQIQKVVIDILIMIG